MKGLMATWDDSEIEVEEDFNEEQTNVALVATIVVPKGYEEPKDKILS